MPVGGSDVPSWTRTFGFDTEHAHTLWRASPLLTSSGRLVFARMMACPVARGGHDAARFGER